MPHLQRNKTLNFNLLLMRQLIDNDNEVVGLPLIVQLNENRKYGFTQRKIKRFLTCKQMFHMVTLPR